MNQMSPIYIELFNVLLLGTPLLVVMLAIVIVYFNNQTWKKMDRVSTLLYKERELIYNQLGLVMMKIGEIYGLIKAYHGDDSN